MKNTTLWANNTAPIATAYTPVAKNAAPWTNNDTKNLTGYTNNAVPTSTNWGVNFQPAQLYLYDDPNIPYDSPLFFYNARVNNNTFNQKLVTLWSNDD